MHIVHPDVEFQIVVMDNANITAIQQSVNMIMETVFSVLPDVRSFSLVMDNVNENAIIKNVNMTKEIAEIIVPKDVKIHQLIMLYVK